MEMHEFRLWIAHHVKGMFNIQRKINSSTRSFVRSMNDLYWCNPCVMCIFTITWALNARTHAHCSLCVILQLKALVIKCCIFTSTHDFRYKTASFVLLLPSLLFFLLILESKIFANGKIIHCLCRSRLTFMFNQKPTICYRDTKSLNTCSILSLLFLLILWNISLIFTVIHS